MKKASIKITYNAPVILTFSLISLVVVFIGTYINEEVVRRYFMIYRAPLTDIFTWFRFVSYVFGHGGWGHFIGNFSYILLLGPLVEEKYGSENLLKMMVISTLVSGLVHFIFFPRVALCGASGIVFMLIIMSSVTSVRRGEIPITLIIAFFIYLAGEVYDAVVVSDNISQLTHIIGGLCGVFFAMRYRTGRK